MRITHISDTHNKHNKLNGKLPGGNILIHSGDFTSIGRKHEVEGFIKWFAKQDYTHKVFTLVYSEVLEQPKWVKYKVTCAENNVSRKGLDFYKEKTIHTSDNEDYVANDWDKGHMAPAAAFGCNAELLKQTFTYLNSALQHKSLNRGVWKELEEYERQLRQKADDIEIYIRVDLQNGLAILNLNGIPICLNRK